MKYLKYVVILGVIAIFFANIFSCKHEPLVLPPTNNPVDTSHHPVDTTHTPVDTTHVDTCAAGVISFQYDVLPILISNCAKSGCHDSITRRHGVIMNNYQNVMSTGRISTTDPLSSNFWQSLTGGEDQMPPGSSLTSQQIAIIQQWLQQGAQNTTCSHQTGGTCDTTNVKYSQFISATIGTYCLGCHSSSSQSGGVNLSSYSNVMTYVNNGQLMRSINWSPGLGAMPLGGSKLDNCTLSKFQAWINAGAQNN